MREGDEETLRPHHLNVDFHWSDHVGPFSAITEQQARSYDELGYFVLEDAFPSELIDQVVAEIDPFEFSQEEQLRTFKDGALLHRPRPTRSPSPPIWSPAQTSSVVSAGRPPWRDCAPT